MHQNKPDRTEPAPGVLVDCPTCQLPAEIIDRFMLGGAPEPVEHVKVMCVRRHWYTLPVDMLVVSETASERASTSGMTPRR